MTVADLRVVWKDAGAAGVLQTQVMNREGALQSVQELLLKRNDEISFQDENPDSAGAGAN